jgi:DNA helicase-2/ATP-dependent DNA helicase PcrA
MPSVRRFEADERQCEAIEHIQGPMLVVAGAGTGKTTVLTRRIARLIREGHARPDEILAVTYTENATREMRDRVQEELRGSGLTDLKASTFHAYCNNLLIGCGQKFGVLDDKDLWIYLRKRLRELHLNYFVRAARVSQFLDDLLDFMRRCHDELVGPEKYAEYVRRLERGQLPLPRVCKSKEAVTLTDDEQLGRCQEIASVFTAVEQMLGEDNLGTFGHMITRACELLSQDPELLTQERKRSRFILVDEFQDANFAQVKILQMLAGEERNVFAVGDPDQAIYQFRGASSAAFELFQRQFPGAKLVALERNRRSTTPILKSAFALISKNLDSFAGSRSTAFPYRRSPLVSAREETALREGVELPSMPVEAVLLTAKEVECSDLVAIIQEPRTQSRCQWKDIAVLYRQHLHRDELVSELTEKGIPFSIENMDVMDTPEVRDLLACLGALVSEADSASLLRVAAFSQFAIDPEKLRAGIRSLPRDAKDAGVALVLRQIENGPAVLDALRQIREEIAAAQAKSGAALEIVIRRFALDRKSRPLIAMLDFVSKWQKKPITKTGELSELLEYLEYFREARGTIPMPPEDDDAVRLMTAHAAKGLEFDHVFIIRANSNSFPSSYKEPLVEFPPELRDSDSAVYDNHKALHDEEERRLFYVAMTRARDSLTIYARQGKGKDATPPGFLRDLLKDQALARWLCKRQARGFQTDLFGEGRTPTSASRTSQWLSLPPASDLCAKLSASAVQTYETCPLQFKLERDWRIPGEVPAAMQYGATMHRVLRAYYDSVRAQRSMADEAVVEFFRSDLAAAGIEDHYQHELYEKQGVAQLNALLAASRRHPVPAVLHLEEPFQVKIGNVTVIGRIDRIDEARIDEARIDQARIGQADESRVVITDYKTGKSQSQEDAEASLQLSIYAMAARQKWGYRVDHLVFYNVGENSAVIALRSDRQLEEAKLRVEAVATNIAEGKFDAKTGFHCNFCHYRNLCPATEKCLQVPAVQEKAGKRNPRQKAN